MMTNSEKNTDLAVNSTEVTHKDARIYALIVAAGKGSRFGAKVPKQYIKLGDKTLLEHSIARLAASHDINHCLVVIAEDDSQAGKLGFEIPVRFAIGGEERWQSVQAGVQALINEGGSSDDLVVIHDAARAAVPVVDIEAVIEAAQQETYGAILATPVTDTLKAQVSSASNESDYISHTVSRRGLWQAQTPQVFRLGALQEVLSHVAKNGLEITDEASAFEALSLPVRLIKGNRQNIKLTYPEDLPLLSAIVAMK